MKKFFLLISVFSSIWLSSCEEPKKLIGVEIPVTIFNDNKTLAAKLTDVVVEMSGDLYLEGQLIDHLGNFINVQEISQGYNASKLFMDSEGTVKVRFYGATKELVRNGSIDDLDQIDWSKISAKIFLRDDNGADGLHIDGLPEGSYYDLLTQVDIIGEWYDDFLIGRTFQGVVSNSEGNESLSFKIKNFYRGIYYGKFLHNGNEGKDYFGLPAAMMDCYEDFSLSAKGPHSYQPDWTLEMCEYSIVLPNDIIVWPMSIKDIIVWPMGKNSGNSDPSQQGLKDKKRN